MASKSFEAISNDIINNILVAQPDADVKIGSVIRDIFIDVQSLQLQSLYNIADKSAQAQSVLTARAQQLDRLGYNFNQVRNQAKRASTNLVISIKSGVQAPTPLNIGDQFFTSADQYNTTQTFINTQLTLLQVGQTQITLPITALNAGSSGNVAAYTIVNSSYDFADSVYNPTPATGGLDAETDASFALRIPLAATGQYNNTHKGILNIVKGISDINGQPFIITPDNPASRGQFTTDVYLQRDAAYAGTTNQETAPANTQDFIFSEQPLYELNPINQVSVSNPATNPPTFNAIQQSINGVQQYQVILDDPGDGLQLYKGTVKANARLHWTVAPPTSPYVVSYNFDHTVVDAQAAFDVFNEITNDLLFKQAPALPIYISAALTAISGANLTSVYQNGYTNLINLFDNLQVGQSLTEREVQFAFLQDNNVLDAILTNFDSTYELSLSIPDITQPDVTQTITTNGTNPFISSITPFGYYWESDVNNPSLPILFYSVTDRLWIGNPQYINISNFTPGTGFSLKVNSAGVPNQNVIRSYTVYNVDSNNNLTPFTGGIFPLYDNISQTLILNFAEQPGNGVVIVLNLVQSIISTIDSLNYLTLAPSLVSPVTSYQSNINTTNPTYATVLPSGLDPARAKFYKNGVALTPGSGTTVGDYTITGVVSGLINLQFTVPPAPTDVFQYGLLNPDLSISTSASQF